MVVCQKTGDTYIPLNHLDPKQKGFLEVGCLLICCRGQTPMAVGSESKQTRVWATRGSVQTDTGAAEWRGEVAPHVWKGSDTVRGRQGRVLSGYQPVA